MLAVARRTILRAAHRCDANPLVLRTVSLDSESVLSHANYCSNSDSKKTGQLDHGQDYLLHGELLVGNGFDVLDMSASNALANSHSDTLVTMRESPEKWSLLLDLEIESSSSPGMIDAGTHLIAVAMKPNG